METYELVDINKNKTGIILTHKDILDKIKIPEGAYFLSAGIVILNDNNEVLLQRRSPNKEVKPNLWGISGGKANINEDTVEAALRETYEEIGIKLNKEDLEFINEAYGKTCIYITYLARKNINIEDCILQEEEVSEVKYYKLDEIKDLETTELEWLEPLKQIIKN